MPNVQASEGGMPVNETPIAANPNGINQLLTGGNDYNCSSGLGFDASHDGGTTWNHKCFGQAPGTKFGGDPVVGYDTAGNAFVGGVAGKSSTVTFFALERSTNGGRTWSNSTVVLSGIAPYTFFDKPWMQVDDGASSPRRNAIYVSSTEFDPSENSAIAVSHSTDGGVTWTSVMIDAAAFPNIDQFTDLAIGADGTVYLSWMRCSAASGTCGGTAADELFSKSQDGGVTWTMPALIATVNLAPDTCASFYGCLPNTNIQITDIPVVDVDRSDGTFADHLYAAMYTWSASQAEIVIARSTDGGATWSTPVRVSPGAPNDEFFPWLTTNAKGFVGVTWLDRRLDPSNLDYDAFASVSRDGGAHFRPAVRLSSVSSDPLNDGFGGVFIGDYRTSAWFRNSLYAAWTDTRTLDDQDEVGGFRL